MNTKTKEGTLTRCECVKTLRHLKNMKIINPPYQSYTGFMKDQHHMRGWE